MQCQMILIIVEQIYVHEVFNDIYFYSPNKLPYFLHDRAHLNAFSPLKKTKNNSAPFDPAHLIYEFIPVWPHHLRHDGYWSQEHHSVGQGINSKKVSVVSYFAVTLTEH